MAVRLGEHIICGEIFNTSHYTVHGWIRLRGQQHPVLLQLTGNCNDDLAGRHIRFEARNAEQLERTSGEGAAEDEFSFLATQQVGPTGTMTAARKVKVAPCSTAELYLRTELGEPPPLQWKRCLYLEWFSQNGRVVVELPDPQIEFVEPQQEEDEEEPEPGGETDSDGPPGIDLGQMLSGFEADDAPRPASGDEPWPWSDGDEGSDPEEEEDPYGLFPAGLSQQFESEASQIDLGLRDGEERSRDWVEMELMDDLIESGPGVPLDELFDGPLKLPRPGQLDDAETESALKTLLAQLALFGISLDICQHFAPRDAYRLLLEEICPEQTAYPELRNTQWVQHFTTSDFCPECEAEFEREYEQEQRRQEDQPGNDAPDEGP